MILTIPPNTPVFRRVQDDGRAYAWHILAGSKSCGFDKNRHPDKPLWWDANSHTALCGYKDDDRKEAYGFIFDGHIKWSTVGDVSGVCLQCFPYLKHYPGEERQVILISLELVKTIEYMLLNRETPNGETWKDIIDEFAKEIDGAQ